MMKSIHDYSYILLGTLRKNGNYVDTPVWFAGEDQQLFIFSNGDAGKVKRLRNFSDATVAPCTVSGKPLGDRRPASAFIIEDAAGIEYAHRMLVRKYGWQMRSLDFFAGLFGRKQRRSWIQIDLRE